MGIRLTFAVTPLHESATGAAFIGLRHSVFPNVQRFLKRSQLFRNPLPHLSQLKLGTIPAISKSPRMSQPNIDVRYVANLARLDLSDAEVATFQGQLDAILGHVESLSALDVSVQAQIINLLKDLQQDSGLTYLFISHDLSVVRHISSRVAVMYVGRLIEVAPTRLLFAHPRHPYTEALLSAVPVPDPAARGRNTRIQVKGEIADPANAPSGCHFHPRCRYATATCAIEVPPLSEVAPGHYAACHHASSLSLAGVASSG